MIKYIVKRDGRTVPFDRGKITMAILSAAVAVGGHDRKLAEEVTDDVLLRLAQKEYKEDYPTVEEIQDLVEKSLIESGHARTAKAFIIYRYEHILKREGTESLTYSSDNIPYQKLWQALSWGLDNRCTSLSDLEFYAGDESKFRALIDACEKFYAAEIQSAMSSILARIADLKIIIVCGPSSSGKTTTTIKVGEALEKQGYSLVTLNVDNYYFNLEDQPKDSFGDYDYETPQAIDLELINTHLHQLLRGATVQIPFYNFKTGQREGTANELRVGPKDIILIDSLHGMFGGMTHGIHPDQKFNLYIETLCQLKDKDRRFIRWTDIRMLRRMVRDMQFRNYNPRQTLTHWHYVRRSELRYIVSRLKEADCIVNSAMPYELPLLKNRMGHLFPEFIREFADDPDRVDALERAERVMKMFQQIPGWTDESVIPSNSLLREFLGGSSYTY